MKLRCGDCGQLMELREGGAFQHLIDKRLCAPCLHEQEIAVAARKREKARRLLGR